MSPRRQSKCPTASSELTSRGACEGFNYGGCKGNANNFETKQACENACVKGKCFFLRYFLR